MWSSFPALSDGFFGSPFPAFEGGFSSWEGQESAFAFPQPDEPNIFPPLDPQEPVISNPGSPNSNPQPVDSVSGSDDPDQNIKNTNSGSGFGFGSGLDDVTNPPVDSVVDERKRRRMFSNRESARRSRMRKQKHLEDLRNQVNRLKLGNRELMNHLRVVSHHCELVRSDNDRLRSEWIILRRRFWDIRQVLLVRQLQQQLAPAPSAWPCNNFTATNEETFPQSLIT